MQKLIDQYKYSTSYLHYEVLKKNNCTIRILEGVLHSFWKLFQYRNKFKCIWELRYKPLFSNRSFREHQVWRKNSAVQLTAPLHVVQECLLTANEYQTHQWVHLSYLPQLWLPSPTKEETLQINTLILVNGL